MRLRNASCGVLAAVATLLVAVVAAAPPREHPSQSARSTRGMVVASTPHATLAGAEILGAGGNAVDAAVATAFALMVTDPAMASLGGRSQILFFLRDGRAGGLDGATQQPERVPALASKEGRSGYQTVPIPGNPRALLHFQALHGKLPRARVLEPAIRLANEGFLVTARVGEIWDEERPRFAKDAGARKHYLKSDGSAYRAGESYRNPALGKVLVALARKGPAAFYSGEIAEAIQRDAARGAGYLRSEDLAHYQAPGGALVRAKYRDFEVLTLGRHAWGNTLAEMLHILAHFEVNGAEPSARDVELLARVIAQALQDRPQALGTLAPKKDGLPLAVISSEEFARERAQQIRKTLEGPPQVPAPAPAGFQEDHDTTHLSVMDAEGNAVALTTSIGPRFGARVASEELGFFYAHSYRMRSSPEPGARDHTEMTPTIVLHRGKPVLVLGAAGSERIPGAILQVLSNVLDRRMSVEQAVRAPRVFSADAKRLRLLEETSAPMVAALRARGFQVDLVRREPRRHLGIVHALAVDPRTGEFYGAADPVYDGAASGPLPTAKGRK